MEIPQKIKNRAAIRYSNSTSVYLSEEIKQQCDTTIHLLEWPKSKTLKPPNSGDHIEQRNSHSLLVGMQNGSYTL